MKQKCRCLTIRSNLSVVKAHFGQVHYFWLFRSVCGVLVRFEGFGLCPFPFSGVSAFFTFFVPVCTGPY